MMEWLIRLKNQKASIDQPPKPAKLTQKCFEVGLEGFEGSRCEQSKKLTLSNDHPDHWCWPNSPAMRSTEIEAFYKRLEGFFGRIDAERLAERLFARDREGSDLVMCVECKHLHGLDCRNWKQAGVAQKANGATLPFNFTVLLQRCDGFTSAFNIAKF
jgi:hypothetical protein